VKFHTEGIRLCSTEIQTHAYDRPTTFEQLYIQRPMPQFHSSSSLPHLYMRVYLNVVRLLIMAPFSFSQQNTPGTCIIVYPLLQ